MATVILIGEQLIAKVTGAVGVEGGRTQALVPRSQTLFESGGLGYQFIIDDNGVATDLVEIHISGAYTYHRQR